MRHYFFLGAVATHPFGMLETTLPGALVAPARAPHRLMPGRLRTLVRAIMLATVAWAANAHLHEASSAQEVIWQQCPSACSVKPNKDGQWRPPSGILVTHPLLWNAGRDTGKLAGFGCRAHLSAATLFYPSVPRLSSLSCTAATHNVLELQPFPRERQWRAISSGRTAAGPRRTPGRAKAWPEMRHRWAISAKASTGMRGCTRRR